VVAFEHEGELYGVAFSSDGRYLATGGSAAARVWTITTARESLYLTHPGIVYAVAFSPDGQYLATANGDIRTLNANAARLWAISSGQEVARITHADLVKVVAFGPNEVLATASAEGGLKISPWLPGTLIAYACKHLTRNLTPDEWRQYLGTEPYIKICPELP
jgi:WD40 repeat protein